MVPKSGPIPELSILNRHPKVLDGPGLLHELVRSSSSTNAPAIDFLEHGSKRRTLTYGELHSASDHLAGNIMEALARLKTVCAIIPVLLPQSLELYVALLAVLKAGKAFCPIGLDTPTERLDFMLRDVSAGVIITDAARRDGIPSVEGLEVISVDNVTPENARTAPPRTPTLLPAALAYVLYTSGSTGLPKAVSVSHRAVTQSLLAHDRHIPHFSRFLQFAAPTFDVSIFEIFFTLYRGCTLVGCERSQMLNDLPAVINSMEVDAAELTPTVVNNLLRGRKSVPELKLLLTIGEMLTQNVIDEFGGHGEVEGILWAMYGPTETAIHCTLKPNFTRQSTVGNIGFPLDTVSAFIAAPISGSSLNPIIEILPFGEEGELVIGGPQVADEYLNRPELSAASFLSHSELGLLYRTGDKARIRPDNTLECLGRIVSGQVKLRGQRVELGEIEQVVLRHESCRSAVAVVIEDTLVAFCVVDLDSTSSAAISNLCGRWLPSYMVPTTIIMLKKIPQMASGKMDKASLEALYRQKLREGGTTSAQTREEGDGFVSSVSSSVQEGLGRSVSLEADFDTLGIDSLRSIRIASSLRAQGFDVGPIDVLSAPNLRRLVTLCNDRRISRTESHKSLSINKDSMKGIPELADLYSDVSDILPCTPLQEAMLTETHIRPRAYCNWVEVEMPKLQSFEKIRGLLIEVASRNEILRSGFLNNAVADSTFVQIVWKRLAETAIQEVSDFSRVYSLGSTESLLRPFAVQALLQPGKSRLLFQMHHALYDGWSFQLLLQDLNHLIAKQDVAARPQYREVLSYHLQLRESPKSEVTRDYWAKLLTDYQPIPLRNFNGRYTPSNGLRSVRGGCAVDLHLLLARAAKIMVNPQVFFQAAVAYILSLYQGSSDVVLGVVTSGRTIPVTNVENIIGPCIASLPFRVDISNISLVQDLLRQTQRSNRDMLDHCSLPLRDIAKACNIRPGERIFDVLFVWQQSLVSSSRKKLEFTPVASSDDLEFKLTLEFEPGDDAVCYRITYNPSILPESQIRYLQLQIDQVVNFLLTNTDGQVDDIDTCFSVDAISVANPTPVLERFQHGPACAVEKMASKCSDSDALVVSSLVNGVMAVQERLSYASLNARANRLAHALLAHGAGNDKLVCILMEKSADLYVSILAVLKIGCGYLPVTPDTPLERTKSILADAEVSMCISDSSSTSAIPQLDSLIVLIPDRLDLTSYSDQNLDIPYNGSHLAYAVFTSGSTGKPKGVLVTQDNLMSNLAHLSSEYPTTHSSRMLQSCSQAFDVSVFEIFFSWYVGMCLCTARASDLFYDFEAAINSLCITHLSLTPTVAGLVPNKVPKVEFLVTAGEPLTENVRRKWAGRGLYQGMIDSELFPTVSDA
jgi:amino acid adenylation domain-containing protein